MKHLILMIFALATCGKKEEQNLQTKGSILFAVGNVTVVSNGNKNSAKKGTPISEGDTILTDSKSTVIVEFSDNAGTIEIQENSEFTVKEFNEKNQELVSKSGSFWLNAKKLKKDTNFNVIMPTSVAGIRGTKLYSFENKELGITGVCHCQGAVEFKENSSNYTGSHDSDFLVLTKAGKTIVITP
ncbi:MAG TPA: FecR domain-containing protein, partial [Leptospiraceae bacterium]|nr:FecR domain-containing protein [Leptospiraceae bacterium]